MRTLAAFPFVKDDDINAGFAAYINGRSNCSSGQPTKNRWSSNTTIGFCVDMSAADKLSESH